MKISEAKSMLQWAYHRYPEHSPGRIEAYLAFRILELHAENSYVGNADIPVESTLYESMLAIYGATCQKFGEPTEANPPPIQQPSQPQDISLMHKQINEILNMAGDQDWINAVQALAEEILPPAEPVSTQTGSSSLYLPSAPQVSAPTTMAGLRTLLEDYLEGFKTHMSTNQYTPLLNNVHVMIMTRGAVYHAMLAQLFINAPSLVSKPATTFCGYRCVMEFIDTLKMYEAQPQTPSIQPVPGVHEGNRTAYDGRLLYEIEQAWTKIQLEGTIGENMAETKKAIECIKRCINERNQSRYYRESPSHDLIKKTIEQEQGRKNKR